MLETLVITLCVVIGFIAGWWDRGRFMPGDDDLRMRLIENMDMLSAKKRDYALIIASFDGVRELRKFYGSQKADKMLKNILGHIREIIPAKKYREGLLRGHEYVVVAQDMEEEKANELCRRINARFSQTINMDGFILPLKVKTGYAISDNGNLSGSEALSMADKNMRKDTRAE